MILHLFRYTICLIITVSFVSCSQEINKNVTYKGLKSINIDASRLSNNFSSLISSSRYVKLETKPECLISNIDKLLFVNKQYYILDTKANSIFVFDSNGKFLSKISKQGNGPDEYTYLMDFDIDDKGNVCILDFNKKKIMVYDRLGQLKNVTTQQYFSQNISKINSSTFLTYQPSFGSKMAEKLILKKGNNIIASYLPADKNRNGLTLLKPFALNRSGKSILFNEDLSDTIFEVSDKEVKAKYALVFGDHTLQPELRNNPEYFKMRSGNIKAGWRINNFFENSNYFTCSFIFETINTVLYYSKKNQKYFYSNCPSCNETKTKVLGDFAAKGVADDYFVSTITYSSVINFRKSVTGENKDQAKAFFTAENYQLIENFKENDNPILVLFKLREM